MTWNFHKERRPPEDFTGRKFGLLTAIRLAPNVSGETRWRCRCECGAETVVTASRLRNGGRTTHKACGKEKHP